jgi:hypothetical protein
MRTFGALPLVRFDLKGGMSARFGWFYNYKDFLAINRANEARQDQRQSGKPKN